jgi:chromosome segregation ATPase
MDDEPTKKFPRSFEQLVLERFDALDARLERLESRSYDTKPIWEKALQEILETQNQLKELRTKIDAIEECRQLKSAWVQLKCGLPHSKPTWRL